MAAFELNIYDMNGDITRTFFTNKVRWSVFLQAFSVQESLSKYSEEKQVQVLNAFMKKLFSKLTDKDIERTLFAEVLGIFLELLGKAQQIGQDQKKNADGGGIDAAPSSVLFELTELTINLSNTLNTTPFELMAQDVDEVILLTNYFVEKSVQTPEIENKTVTKQTKQNDGFWSFN